jgi:hypothetical protein
MRFFAWLQSLASLTLKESSSLIAVGDFDAKESSKLSILLNLMLSIFRDYFLQEFTQCECDLPRLGKLIHRPFRCSSLFELILIIGITSRNVC